MVGFQLSVERSRKRSHLAVSFYTLMKKIIIRIKYNDKIYLFFWMFVVMGLHTLFSPVFLLLNGAFVFLL